MYIKSLVEEKFKTLNNKKEISFKFYINKMLLSAYCYIKPNADKLFIVLNGALDREKTKDGIIYHRYSWVEHFDGHVLFIADPTLTLYKDINLAWYMGDKYTPLYETLAMFITECANNLNCEYIVTYGSSGGGFASMQLACLLDDNAMAVAVNPQTNIIKWFEDGRDSFLSDCFSTKLNEIKFLNDNSRFNAIKNIKENKPKILYIQNAQDKWHVKNHFEPLLKELNITGWSKTFELDKHNKSFLQILWYDHPSGHGAELKEHMPIIMNSINLMLNNN